MFDDMSRRRRLVCKRLGEGGWLEGLKQMSIYILNLNRKRVVWMGATMVTGVYNRFISTHVYIK